MFWYFATPYTNYPEGRETAFNLAAEQASLLMRHRVPIFCPITHTHPIAAHVPADIQNHDFWMSVDRPFMRLAFGMIVCKLPGWKDSDGIAYETDFFKSRGKPVFYMQPDKLPDLSTLRAYEQGRDLQNSRLFG